MNFFGLSLISKKYKSLPCLVIMGLTCMFLACNAFGQGKPKRENPRKEAPPKTRAELSMDTIMTRLDNLHLTLDRINNFSRLTINTREIEKQLPEIQSNLDIIKDNLSIYNDVLGAKNLQLFGVYLEDMENKIYDWRASLFKFNADLITMNAEIAQFAKDSVIRQMIQDSNYRKMYTNELNELTQKWSQASSATHSNLELINRLQSAISHQYFETIELENKVSQLKKISEANLFRKEFNYLWEKPDSAVSANYLQITSLTQKSLKGQKKIMNYFVRGNTLSYLLAAVIGLGFFLWIFINLGIMRKKGDQQILESTNFQYIPTRPVLAALTVVLNIVPFFDLDAPSAYTHLLLFFQLIVLTLFFYQNWRRSFFLYWLLIVALYILFSVTVSVPVPTTGVRLVLLLLNIIAVSLGFLFITRIIKGLPLTVIVKIVSVIYLALNIFSILCNLTGRVNLAKIFSNAAISGMVQIIGLTVFIKIIIEALVLQSATGKIKNETAKSTLLFEKLQKGLSNLLTLLSVFVWLVVFSINLNVYDNLFLIVSDIMNTYRNIGSTRFKIGDVFLFFIILYISNIFQKYVGYLFGASDEHSLPAGGKKGSHLVMTRLILIVLGFFLAVVASGLPVDKITIVLGALGVGIGLGLQTIVNNLVSGIILIFERPFHIGDYIQLNDKRGIVRDIGIRSSRLVTEEGTEIIMPNGDLLSGQVINWTVKNNQVRIELPVTIESGTSFENVQTIVNEALQSNDTISKETKPKILLVSESEQTVHLSVVAWVENISKIQTIKSEILVAIYNKLKERGIKVVG